jgi:hypothetical protein
MRFYYLNSPEIQSIYFEVVVSLILGQPLFIISHMELKAIQNPILLTVSIMPNGAALNEVNTHWSDNQAIVMHFASFRKAEQ